MAKVEIEVSDDILKFVDEKGYEITKLGICQKGDTILYFNSLSKTYAVGVCDGPESTYAVIHVRLKPRYRPAVAPQDLGKVCEFSEWQDFNVFDTGELNGVYLSYKGVVTYVRLIDVTNSDVRAQEYHYCRILDNETPNAAT